MFINPLTSSTATVATMVSLPCYSSFSPSNCFVYSSCAGTSDGKNTSSPACGSLVFHCGFEKSRILVRRRNDQRFFSGLGFRIYCEKTKAEETNIKIRRYAPAYVERTTRASSNGSLASDDWRAVPDIWRSSAEKYGDRIALVDPHHDPPTSLTYTQLEQEILDFSEGLRAIGANPDEKIALFADNSYRWLVADQGMMAMGAINVARGSRFSVQELLHIYCHSESVALAVDNPELFNRTAETFSSKAALRFVILLWGEKSSLTTNGMKGVPIFNYKEIIDLGRGSRKALFDADGPRQHYKNETISSDDIAMLLYTSGTTGNPKAVMLTHKNLLHQINNLWEIVPVQPGDRFLSMLPPWHSYERTCDYFIFTHGIELVYTTVQNLKNDLQKYQPHYVLTVPLIFETLYSGIQKQISASSTLRKLVVFAFIRISLAYMEMKRIYEGNYLTKSPKEPSNFASTVDWLWARILAAVLLPIHMLAMKLVYCKIHSGIGMSKAGVSAGGSLPSHVDKFFEAVGVTLQNGYGMTETAPVTAARRTWNNVLGSVGHPVRHTEFKIVDAETAEALPYGSKGLVKVRGPQVMKGYYKNPLATKQAIDEEGWLNTGDIGWIAPHHSIGRSRRCGGVIVLDGRAKDTIVLSTGENVEPVELEEAAMRSSLIQQIVVIGQDQRRLGAIVVPNKEDALVAAKKLSVVDADASELSKEQITSLLYEELRNWTSGCSFKIGPILIIDEPFTIDGGLMTPTMKIRRDKVVAKYSEQIGNLYKQFV